VDHLGDEFFARPARSFDKHAAFRFCNIRQELYQLLHLPVHADNVINGPPFIETPFKVLDVREIPEELHGTDHLSIFIFQLGGGDTDGEFMPLAGDDVHPGVLYRVMVLERILEGASRVTDLGAENIEAVLAYCFTGHEAGDLLRSPVERGYDSILVYREHPITDALKDQFAYIFHGAPSPDGSQERTGGIS